MLDALRFKGYGNLALAQRYLDTAQKKFASINYEQGLRWIAGTRETILDTSTIQVSIQTGHLAQYNIFPSPNPKYFATSSDDYTFKIWDISLGKQIKTVAAHKAAIDDMVYSPGGRYLASLSEDSTIKIWNTFNYNLTSQINLGDQVRCIAFSPDGKQLLVSGYDSTITFWDPFTGKQLSKIRIRHGYVRNMSFHPLNASVLDLVCTDSCVYEYHMDDSSYHRIITGKGRILSFSRSPDGNYVRFTKSDSTIHFFNAVTDEWVYSDRLYSWKYGSTRFLHTGSFSPDSKYFVYCNSEKETAVLNLAERKTRTFNFPAYQQLAFSKSGAYIVKAELFSAPGLIDFSNFDWNNKDESLGFRNFESYINPPLYGYFSADGTKLRYNGNFLNEFDLSTGQTKTLSNGANSSSAHSMPFLSDSTILLSEYAHYDTVKFYQFQSKDFRQRYWMPKKENITAFLWDEANHALFLGGENGSIACWDVQKNKLSYYVQHPANHKARVNFLSYSDSSKRYYIFPAKEKPYCVDAISGKNVRPLPVGLANRIIQLEDRLFIASDSGRIFEIDALSLRILQILKASNTESDNYGLAISDDQKLMYLLDEPMVHVMDISSGKIVRDFDVDGKNLSSITLSPKEDMLAICSFNSYILLYNPQSGKLITKLYTPLMGELIAMDSVGHYMASRQALQSVVFNYGGRSYSFDQFDLQLNQPHKILAALGKASSATIAAYEKAWQKRLTRSGVQQTSNISTAVPSIIIHERSELKPVTSKTDYEITFECFDFKTGLNSFYITVNDVPYTDTAINWYKKDSSLYFGRAHITLTPGQNNIKFRCTNKAGISSFTESVNVQCMAQAKKQRLWFVGIGVANYADTTMNLTYSAKDIRDLAATFKKVNKDAIIDTLLNDKVTLDQIALLGERLKKADINNKVILAVTGHGLLSNSLDFYYATYNIDADKPEKNGLSYDALENLLADCGARQKLLLIDACHSGLLDKESLMAAKTPIITRDNDSTAVVKNTRSIIRIVPPKVNPTATFNLMQNLFADLSGSNGIAVISAAGGMEYAFESPNWNNGVFTYCVRKAIEEKAADKESAGGNWNGKVSIQELARFVSARVSELTDGKQKPASRRESLDNDWEIE